MASAGSGQSSRTPFDHLRYYYPETWKTLVGMMEEKGAVTNLAGERRPEGLRIYGSHDSPNPQAAPKLPELSQEEKDKIATKVKNEASAVHQLNLLKNSHRNPTGCWYEGITTYHKISKVYNEPKINDPDQEGDRLPVNDLCSGKDPE